MANSPAKAVRGEPREVLNRLPQALQALGHPHSTQPVRTDVKFPILGFLMESAMTGYDLKRRFQDSVGYFYRVSDGSLYPALKKLAHDGLVTMRAESNGLRTRKVYAITPKGRERFLLLLREPAAPLYVYDEAQVKIFFGIYDPQAALAHMKRMRQFDTASAAALRELAVEMQSNPENRYRRIMVELGRVITEAKAALMAKLETSLARELASAPRTRAGDKTRKPAAGKINHRHGRA
jgi:DNA-binding PadR family transcriptional regulator